MKKTTLSYTLLLLFAFIGYLTVSGSQSVTRLSSLRVSATSEIPALGASELGQQPGIRSADRHHLALRYQDAVWQIANISPGKKVDVRTDKRDTLFLKRLPLEQNDEIQLGHNLLKVTAVSDDSISLTSPTTGNTAEWRNGILFLKGQTVYPASWWNLFKQRQRGSKALFLSGDYAKRQAGIVPCFVIQGLLVIHLLQWSISWGNTLGILPVMGQPMTWLSSGNSHLASVGVPALILGLLGCWVTEYDDTA